MGFFNGNDQYDIHVSTQPMADKIDVVSNKVDMTTGAVAAMETAVIAQEKSSTEQICGKLDVGFFNVVISRIISCINFIILVGYVISYRNKYIFFLMLFIKFILYFKFIKKDDLI